MRVLSYPTYKSYVCLGNVSKKTRDNAKAAGLTSLTHKQFAKLLLSVPSLNRTMYSGEWYNTVHY